MNRIDDVVRLYEILGKLQHRLGQRRLRDCDGRMPWPSHGVYFFFEDGEVRTDSGHGPRVVRIGTHALTATSKTTLWNRLSQHRGVVATGAGNHRGSIFRLLIGEALLHRDAIELDTWGVGDTPGKVAITRNMSPAAVRQAEHAIERAVSNTIGAMPFLWVSAPGGGGPGNPREVIERNSIALLSNFEKAPIDAPSSRWLGHHSGREKVRKSGLWNQNHVEERYDPSFLDALGLAAVKTEGL